MADELIYPGVELETFQYAKNWKQYFSSQIKPYISGDVLEVGAGLGSTTLLLNDGSSRSWLLLEPDETMSRTLLLKKNNNELPQNCEVLRGTTDNVISGSFDTVIYIDVLEHIEADAAELQKAFSILRKKGHLIILSPAFNCLYSPFDKAIGHYRRYTKKTLSRISPFGTNPIQIKYYDNIGFFAAFMNKLLLKQRYPSIKQVLFWDRWMVPVSKITDNIFFHSFGKSIIGIWKKQ